MEDNRGLTEQEIRTRFITPAILARGWDLHTQVREELQVTNGRILVRGAMHARADARRADYVLFLKPNLPLAVVEAKDNRHSVGSGMQQALTYASMFDVPFAFSSNGDAFLFHDKTATDDEPIEREIPMSAFPSPGALWTRLCEWKGLTTEQRRLVEQEYHVGDRARSSRYYQSVAVNRAVESFARGDKRVLLVMATGTGKTYTAFQIIWRLWRARAVKRVLFLVDRNVLADQAFTNDFAPFGPAMTKISDRNIAKSYEIFVSLYQAISGAEEDRNVYREFASDFFDLIVVDECHRGSAAENSAWREVLDYFDAAVHLGLTATPKETRDVSTTVYFGDPVFTYSLKQGIDDGFLAPFKVVRVDIDRDLQGWRPERGRIDRHGREIEDRVYTARTSTAR